jgi:hypothetical protein
MTDAADYTTIVEQKMRKLKEKCSILEAHKLSESAEVSRSKKRQRPNESGISSQERSRLVTRGRKRRSVAIPKGADIIIVSV